MAKRAFVVSPLALLEPPRKILDGNVENKRILIALTGASGAPYFVRLVDRLRGLDGLEAHLISSEGGRRVLHEETDRSWNQLTQAPFIAHSEKNLGALPASGSNRLDAMVILPCSMNSLSAIAHGLTINLIHRCAAVQLKEGRPLIVVFREAPLSLMNLQAMVALKQAGAVLMPAAPGFYQHPKTVEDLLDTIVDRVIDHLLLADPNVKRWNP